MPSGPKCCAGVALAIAALTCALGSRVAALQSPAGTPDLSTVSKANREMIESACSRDKAGHADCVRRQLAALQASPGAPDLTAMANGDQRMMESACSGDRYLNGPAAYYSCLRRQLTALQASLGAPDLSALSRGDQQRIESACGSDRYMHGPAAYYNCLRRQLAGSPDRPSGVAAPAKSTSHLHRLTRPATPARRAHKDAKPRLAKKSRGNHDSTRPTQPSGARAAPEAKADSVPNAASPPASSPSHARELTAGLVVLLVAAALAGVLYKRAPKKKCVRCRKPAAATGPYCPTCFDVVTEAAMREAEEQAMAEEERRARLPRRNAISDSSPFDPYAVLGINRDASLKEIRAAYRREIVNCHPDKVAHLGEEFQEIAKTRAQEINRAYEALAQAALH